MIRGMHPTNFYGRILGLMLFAFVWVRPVSAENVLAVMYFDIETDNTSVQRLRKGLANLAVKGWATPREAPPPDHVQHLTRTPL